MNCFPEDPRDCCCPGRGHESPALRPVGYRDDPAHFRRPTRRELLRVGMVGSVGLALGDLLRLQALAPAAAAGQSPGSRPASAADAMILIFLEGGMSHYDSFDPKPYATLDIRGELGVVNTRIEGAQFSGLWPRTAAAADKIAVIRSMTHGEAAHERGSHNMLTGFRPSPAIVYPSMGSVVAHELGGRNDVPPYVAVPNAGGAFGFDGTGYLSPAYGPFSIGAEPAADNFVVRDLSLPPGVDETRLTRRRGLLAAVDAHFRQVESGDTIAAMDSFYSRAYGMISSKNAREAFHIAAEPAATRDLYGRHAIGQRLLLARRLVEAGARFVTVFYGGFDFHQDIHGGMRSVVPPLDQAFAGLVSDLATRGLLARTLVMMTTEFGRTARINKDRGRDHWPRVFSVAFAGGGIRAGQVIGASTADGTEPATDPIGPADISATILSRLGVDITKKLRSPDNRPIDIVRDGTPIAKLG